MTFKTWVASKAKTVFVHYAVDIILAIIILLYTLHRIDQHYDKLEKKVDKTYELVYTIIQGSGAYLDTVSRNVASVATQATADFKENRKDVYRTLYERFIKKDTAK